MTKKIVRTIDESTSKEEKARILMMSRNLFDQDKGAELLKEVLLKVDNDLMERYTVLSSSFCLLHYLQVDSRVRLVVRVNGFSEDR